VSPPVPWAQTCNIVYPRDVLERTAGFDESLPVAAGEDTDLALRARDVGTAYVAAPEMETHHAVEGGSLRGRVRDSWRWQHLPFVVRRHPEVRRELPLGVFWKPAHARLPLAIAGLAGARRFPPAALLALPWAAAALPSYGSGARGRLRAVSELPGRLVVDTAELAALARGSVRYRTVLL